MDTFKTKFCDDHHMISTYVYIQTQIFNFRVYILYEGIKNTYMNS